MKQKMNFAHVSRTVFLMSLMVFACFAAARAQSLPPNGTLIPRVCYEAKTQTFTRTLANSVPAGFNNGLNVTPALPASGFYSLVLNPGGATEERRAVVYPTAGGGTNLTAFGGLSVLYSHAAGETILLTIEGEAVFSYQNTSDIAISLGRGVSSQNYFFPGPLVYGVAPANFLPGVHENAFRVPLVSTVTLNWVLNGGQVSINTDTPQNCATITYQGRLSDAGNAANGQFDLQFQAFETATDSAAQSDVITLENVQVTNGVFTVPLFFGSTLTNNFKARFLEIGVRAGSSTGAFTTLAPRQPLTEVPYAVNAQNAASATTAANAINATNATNATSAANATNATQLGGVPAANYLTNTSPFGQSVTTVSGTGSLNVTSATTAYTLVPGLTQIINVPANSSLLISTDGGIQSSGAINTFSVVDAAILVDSIAVSERRIVISNYAVAASVDNWALSQGLTLPAGNHKVEVFVKYGGGQPANVSSNSDALLRGKLTIAVIRN